MGGDIKSSVKNGITLLCLTAIITITLPVHAKNKNKNNNHQPSQTQLENGNSRRIQALGAEDVWLHQLIADFGSSGAPKGDAGVIGQYWSRA